MSAIIINITTNNDKANLLKNKNNLLSECLITLGYYLIAFFFLNKCLHRCSRKVYAYFTFCFLISHHFAEFPCFADILGSYITVHAV